MARFHRFWSFGFALSAEQKLHGSKPATLTFEHVVPGFGIQRDFGMPFPDQIVARIWRGFIGFRFSARKPFISQGVQPRDFHGQVGADFLLSPPERNPFVDF